MITLLGPSPLEGGFVLLVVVPQPAAALLLNSSDLIRSWTMDHGTSVKVLARGEGGTGVDRGVKVVHKNNGDKLLLTVMGLVDFLVSVDGLIAFSLYDFF